MTPSFTSKNDNSIPWALPQEGPKDFLLGPCRCLPFTLSLNPGSVDGRLLMSLSCLRGIPVIEDGFLIDL